MKSFSSSQLHPAIIHALESKGILTPSEIQAKTIPLLLEHKGDFVGRSATGTGKTYAYAAPLLSRINVASKQTQAVVLVPTRELCEQVGNELSFLGNGIEDLNIEAIYGGMSIKKQTKALGQGCHIIVATPGRLLDLIERQVVRLASLDFLIFDEADEMLLKGFRKDIDRILATSKSAYSTWLFSATMPDEINSIIKKYLHKDLKKVLIGKKERTNVGIVHQAIKLKAEDKLNVLLYHLARLGNQRGIIFCRTKAGVQKLYKKLSANKFSSGAIHGDLPQGLRNKVMEQYREGHIDLLIATDVASRGVDIKDVSFVIQYHVPDTSDAYTHRSGRSSRAGNKGLSITFIFEEEQERLSLIEEELALNLNYLELPSVKDQMVNKAILWGRKVAKEKPLGELLDNTSKQAFKDQLKHLSKEEIFEKLLANYLRDL